MLGSKWRDIMRFLHFSGLVNKGAPHRSEEILVALDRRNKAFTTLSWLVLGHIVLGGLRLTDRVFGGEIVITKKVFSTKT